MEGNLKIGNGYGFYRALAAQDNIDVTKMSSADRNQLLLDEFKANESFLETNLHRHFDLNNAKDVKDITDPNSSIWTQLDNYKGGATLILDSNVLKNLGMMDVTQSPSSANLIQLNDNVTSTSSGGPSTQTPSGPSGTQDASDSSDLLTPAEKHMLMQRTPSTASTLPVVNRVVSDSYFKSYTNENTSSSIAPDAPEQLKRDAIVKYAESQIGNSDVYGGGEWCAEFASTVLARTIGSRFGIEPYVPTIGKWATQYGRWDKTPKPGDLIVFQWNGDSQLSHIGVVTSVDPNGTIHTVEGNVCGSDGSKVSTGSYKPNDPNVKGFIDAT